MSDVPVGDHDVTARPITGGDSFTIRAVCVVEQLITVPGRVGVSAIDKRPVDGPVQVRELGLHGDIQADRKHHGGEWKAVYLLFSVLSGIVIAGAGAFALMRALAATGALAAFPPGEERLAAELVDDADDIDQIPAR